MRQDDARQQGLLLWLSTTIDPHSGLPVSLQLQSALERAIERGTLRPGDALPTIRTLAAHLRLAPNTVSKAYAALQRNGYTENRAGAGTTVISLPQTATPGQAGALGELRTLLLELLRAGVSPADLHATLEEVLHGDRLSENAQ
ncbi:MULTISPECIES: GntR family transcriptional regulator [Deinococcus]|uniref:GntR family transcriptional regulator n=1 Tax=Deinococcus rufus TaxID=2136097 RepID=A0ABV7Z4C3_9DEIO|nr:GntR family transcriptional regulator [Deinococcus sp. AB2017081]WQE96098.1 GntR family transcriptional regulator [Deinococcus sp. AB2017081]